MMYRKLLSGGVVGALLVGTLVACGPENKVFVSGANTSSNAAAVQGTGTASSAGTSNTSQRGSDFPLPQKFDTKGLTLPKDNQITKQAVLAALNGYLKQHWQGPGVFKPFRPQDVMSGPASQSDYAELIRNTYGPEAIRYSWWIAAGEPGVPFNQLRSPALVRHCYFVDRNGTWELWYQYPY
jgi:hypothetical protein